MGRLATVTRVEASNWASSAPAGTSWSGTTRQAPACKDGSTSSSATSNEGWANSSTRSPTARPNRSDTPPRWFSRAARPTATGFGMPVEPEVWMMYAAPGTAAAGRAAGKVSASTSAVGR